jgi:hypothetical protein
MVLNPSTREIQKYTKGGKMCEKYQICRPLEFTVPCECFMKPVESFFLKTSIACVT